MAESERDTSRAVVKTYVPAYQRDAWDDHAEELEMSRSEFVRSMVQAGRRGFEGPSDPPSEGSQEETEPTPDQPMGPGEFEELVIESLAADEFRSWEELLADVTEGIEDRLEETLQDLQAADRVRYSGRNGGYTLDP